LYFTHFEYKERITALQEALLGLLSDGNGLTAAQAAIIAELIERGAEEDIVIAVVLLRLWRREAVEQAGAVLALVDDGPDADPREYFRWAVCV
jgi:hypothetical protein